MPRVKTPKTPAGLLQGIEVVLNQLNVLTLQAIQEAEETDQIELAEVTIVPIESSIREGKICYPIVRYVYYAKGNVLSFTLHYRGSDELPPWSLTHYGKFQGPNGKHQLHETLHQLKLIAKLMRLSLSVKA